MNLLTEQKQTRRMCLWLRVRGGDRVRYGHIQTAICKMLTKKELLYIKVTPLSVMLQPGWEGTLGENGYMYMYG